jgi:hypothetical protein
MSEINRLLDDYAKGNRAVLDELLPLVYGEFRRLAHSYLTRERQNITLQTTALVHEAYLKLIDQRSVDFKNRGQFFALSAQRCGEFCSIMHEAVMPGSGATA